MGLCVVVVVESIVVWFIQILLLHLLFLKNSDALEPLNYLVSTLLKTKNVGVEKYDCSYHQVSLEHPQSLYSSNVKLRPHPAS